MVKYFIGKCNLVYSSNFCFERDNLLCIIFLCYCNTLEYLR